MNAATNHGWIQILTYAILALVFGGGILILISLRMYRTEKLSNFLFGGLIINPVVGSLFSWGSLYFVADILLDVLSFESSGYDNTIIYLSAFLSVIISNVIIVVILIKRNIEGKAMINDMFGHEIQTEEDQSIAKK